MSKPVHADPTHTLTIAAMAHAVNNMAAIMDKAERHAAANNVPLENLLQSRLYPDMFNLLQQLQYVAYLSVDFARHFTEAEPPRVGYDEATWPELRASMTATAAFLATIKAARVTADADKVVPTFMDDKMGMPAVNYAAFVIVPDFYFHAVLAYALLRHGGVPLGKSDFLGKLDMKPIA